MSYKRKLLDSVVPPFLDRKTSPLKAVLFKEDLIIATYTNSGSFVFAYLDENKHAGEKSVRVDNKLALVDLSVQGSYIISTHRDEIKKERAPDQAEKKQKLTKRSEITSVSVIQLYNTVTKEAQLMRFDFEFKIVFPTTFGLIMVYPDKFARISYENFGQFDKIREIANNSGQAHQFPIGVIPEHSRLKDNKLLLAARHHFQLWNIETGMMLYEGTLSNQQTFIICELVGETVFTSTAKSFHLWNSVVKGGTRYERPVPLSAVYVAGQVLYMGDLAGNVSFFNLANGETGSLNYQESTTVTKPLVEQLKTRISDIKVVKDLVIVASHAGEVTVWSIVDRNRKVPRQSIQTGGHPIALHVCGADNQEILINIQNPNSGDELHRWSPKLKELGGYGEVLTKKVSDEVSLSGALYARFSLDQKWKFYYFQLQRNLLYMFKNSKYLQHPLGTFVLTKNSALQDPVDIDQHHKDQLRLSRGIPGKEVSRVGDSRGLADSKGKPRFYSSELSVERQKILPNTLTRQTGSTDRVHRRRASSSNGLNVHRLSTDFDDNTITPGLNSSVSTSSLQTVAASPSGPKQQYLTVKVLGASGIPCQNLDTHYIVLTCKDQKEQTTSLAGQNPKWNQVFTFTGAKFQNLTCEIFFEYKSKAKMVLPLQKLQDLLLHSGTVSRTRPLRCVSKDNEPYGVLTVELSLGEPGATSSMGERHLQPPVADGKRVAKKQADQFVEAAIAGHEESESTNMVLNPLKMVDITRTRGHSDPVPHTTIEGSSPGITISDKNKSPMPDGQGSSPSNSSPMKRGELHKGVGRRNIFELSLDLTESSFDQSDFITREEDSHVTRPPLVKKHSHSDPESIRRIPKSHQIVKTDIQATNAEEQFVPSGGVKDQLIATPPERRQRYFTLMISLEAFMYFSAPSREQEQEWLKACRKAISAVQATYAWEIDFFAIEFHTDKYGKRISLTKNAKTEVLRGLYNCQDVVVKIFHTGQNRDDFRNKANTLSALKHANILEIVGVCTQSHLAIVQPFVKLGSLAAYITSENFVSRSWTWKLFVKIATDVASALSYMHNFTVNNTHTPIIHKNLSLSNLLLQSLDTDSYHTNVYVTNFGIGQLLNVNKTKESVATIAPEVFVLYKYSTATDVYSFGVVLWQMLTLTDPWAGHINTQIMEKVRAGTRPPIPDGTLTSLQELIEICWSHDPEDRPPFISILDMLVNIGAEFVSEGIIDHPVQGKKVKHQTGDLDSVIHKMVGRLQVVSEILQSLELFRNGVPVVCVVSGKAGMGKSMLINNVSSYASNQGFFCHGRFRPSRDQTGPADNTQVLSQTPHGGLIEALRNLFNKLLSVWTDKEKESWQNRFLYTFDDLGLYILEHVLPKFEGIKGGMRDDSHEITSGKLRMILVKLVHLLATKDHPLIMILDDVQWATQEDIEVLYALFAEPIMPHLLLVTTYRTEEMQTNHPFMLGLLNLRERMKVLEMNVGLFTADETHEAVSNVFRLTKATPTEITTMAERVHERTQGHPQLTSMSVLYLYSEFSTAGKIMSDLELSCIAFYNKDFLFGKLLSGFPKFTVSLLYIASCLETDFSAATMALLNHLIIFEETQGKVEVRIVQGKLNSFGRVSDEDQITIEKALKPPVRRLLLFKDQDSYNLTENQPFKDYLYKRIPEKILSEIHYTIGALFVALSESPHGKQHHVSGLINATNQLCQGVAHINTRGENVQIAKLFLRAARLSRTVRVFGPAKEYLQKASSLLHIDSLDKPWEQCFDLAGNIWVELRNIDYSQNDGQSWRTMYYGSGLTVAIFRGNFDHLLTQPLQFRIFEAFLREQKSHVQLHAFKMGSKFLNTNFIVEDMKISATIYLLKHYILQELMKGVLSEEEEMKWNSNYLKCSEFVTTRSGAFPLNELITIIKTHLRKLYLEMCNEMLLCDRERGKIRFYTWELDKRWNGLLVDTFLYSQFHEYLQKNPSHTKEEKLLDFYQDLLLFLSSLEGASQFHIKKTVNSLITTYLKGTPVTQLPQELVDKIIQTAEADQSTLIPMLNIVEEKLRTRFKAFALIVRESQEKRQVERAQIKLLAGTDPRFRFDELLIDCCLFRKFLKYLGRKNLENNLYLYKDLSEYRVIIDLPKRKKEHAASLISYYFEDRQIVASLEFIFDLKTVRKDIDDGKHALAFEDIYSRLKTRLFILYGDFCEKNVRTSRNLSVANLKSGSFRRTPEAGMLLSSFREGGVKIAGEKLSKLSMKDLKTRWPNGIVSSGDDLLLVAFENFLAPRGKSSDFGFFIDVRRFKEGDLVSAEALQKAAAHICQTYLGMNGTQIKLSPDVGGDGVIIQHITKMVQAGDSQITTKVFDVILSEVEAFLRTEYVLFCQEVKEFRNRRDAKKAEKAERKESNTTFSSATKKKLKTMNDKSQKKKNKKLLHQTLQDNWNQMLTTHDALYTEFNDWLPDKLSKDRLSFCKECLIFKNTKYRTVKSMTEAATAIAKKYFGFGGGPILLSRNLELHSILRAFEEEKIKLDVFDAGLAYAKDVKLRPAYDEFCNFVSERPDQYEALWAALFVDETQQP